METPVFNSYEIQITDSKGRCIAANGEPGKEFLFPDVSDNLPKLYVVKNGRQLYYVGITIQVMGVNYFCRLPAKIVDAHHPLSASSADCIPAQIQW